MGVSMFSGMGRYVRRLAYHMSACYIIVEFLLLFGLAIATTVAAYEVGSSSVGAGVAGESPRRSIFLARVGSVS